MEVTKHLTIGDQAEVTAIHPDILVILWTVIITEFKVSEKIRKSVFLSFPHKKKTTEPY